MGDLYFSEYEADKILRDAAKEHHGGEGSEVFDDEDVTTEDDKSKSPSEKLKEAEQALVARRKEKEKEEYKKGAQGTVDALRKEIGVNPTPPGERLRNLTSENNEDGDKNKS